MGCRPENRTDRFRLSSSSSSNNNNNNIHALISASFILLLFIFQIALATTRDDDINKDSDRHQQPPQPPQQQQQPKQQQQQPKQQQRNFRRPRQQQQQQQQQPVVRYYKLNNRCSQLHVSVKGSVVQAKAKLESHYAWLRFESVALGSVLRIQSNTSHGYLCFTATGALTVKHSIDERKKRCIFQEIHAPNDYSQFKSMANRRWFIGFNRNGTRLAGNQWTKTRDRKERMKCFQFVKVNGFGQQTPSPFHLHGVTEGAVVGAPRATDPGPPGRPRRSTQTSTRKRVRDRRTRTEPRD